LKRDTVIESFKDLTKQDGMKLIDMMLNQANNVKVIIQTIVGEPDHVCEGEIPF
jgi:ABC-type uncharacterized transport system substrate-binding protein